MLEEASVSVHCSIIDQKWRGRRVDIVDIEKDVPYLDQIQNSFGDKIKENLCINCSVLPNFQVTVTSVTLVLTLR